MLVMVYHCREHWSEQMTTINCAVCGELTRPQEYNDPYVCRSCRAAVAIANEIDAARKRGAAPAYIQAMLICQALVSKPELSAELGI
jgi:hypothetical protein